MRRISLLACSSLLFGGLTLGACGDGDDDNGTGGTGGEATGGNGTGGLSTTGGNANSGGSGTGGAATGGSGTGGATGGMGGMMGMGGYSPIDHHSCGDLPALGMGGGSFTIESPDFEDCEPLPASSTCDGEAFGAGDSPALEWMDAPAGTKSYAIVFKDISIIADERPDAFSASQAYHWVVWDIPADISELPSGIGEGHLLQGDLAGARQWSVNNFAYLGACPNPFEESSPLFTGTLNNDSYSFVLYALDVETLGELPSANSDAANPNSGGINWVPDMDAYLMENAIAVTEVRATSDAWAAQFVPPTLPVPPCTEDEDEADGECVDGEP